MVSLDHYYNYYYFCYPGPAVTVAVVLTGASQVLLRLFSVGHGSIIRLTILSELSCEVDGGESQNGATKEKLLKESNKPLTH